MSEGVPVSVPVSAGAGSRLVLGRLHMTAEIVAAEICDFNRNFQSNVAPTKTMKDPQRFSLRRYSSTRVMRGSNCFRPSLCTSVGDERGCRSVDLEIR